MADVKWIKINVDMFDDEKIKIIQSMPEGDSLLIVWIKLITLAGKTNDGGYIYISENMPYTEEMLSIIMNKSLNIIRLALSTFTNLGMIENDTKGIYLINFEKHQSLDKLAEIREQTRKRVAEHRARKKQKLLDNSNVTLQVTQSNAIDKDIEEEEEEDKDRDREEEIIIQTEFESLWKLYPKKVGKDKSYQKYKKYRTSTKKEEYCTYEEVLKGLERYLEYIKQNAWYHPKDGSTWFNNRSWNDDYSMKEESPTEWFDKEIKVEKLSEEDSKRMDDLIKDLTGE